MMLRTSRLPFNLGELVYCIRDYSFAIYRTKVMKDVKFVKYVKLERCRSVRSNYSISMPKPRSPALCHIIVTLIGHNTPIECSTFSPQRMQLLMHDVLWPV